MRDFKRLRQDPPQGVNGSPNPDNIMLWNAVIFGPEDTPWDGGTFQSRARPLLARTSTVGDLLLPVQRAAAVADALLVCTFAVAGTFKLTLEFSEDYPNKAPVVKFKSTMFHPNSKCCVLDQWVIAGAPVAVLCLCVCLACSQRLLPI